MFGENRPVEETGQQAAQHLGGPARQNLLGRKALASHQAERDGGIDMATGDVTDGVGHGQQGQSKGEGDAQKADACGREGCGEERGSAAPEDQPESTKALCNARFGRDIAITSSWGFEVSGNA